LPYLLTIDAYGFYWFRLSTDAEVPAWHQQILLDRRASGVVLFDGWSSLFRERVVPWRIGMAEKTRQQFETDAAALHRDAALVRGQGHTIERARIADHVLWQEGKIDLADGHGRCWRRRRRGERMSYFMPLALAWEEGDEERMRNLSSCGRGPGCASRPTSA
jgi:maltose alpha-D-glucosyltransferase/alpha-amylase